MLKIFCDGGCKHNGKANAIGGYGAIIQHGTAQIEFSDAFHGVTNNQMELLGALVALQHLPTDKKHQTIIVTSDSMYLVKGMSQWVTGWIRRNWKTSTNQDVVNKDLWVQLKAYDDKHMILWEWCKGHAGHVMNEKCDSLATEAIRRLETLHHVSKTAL